MILFSEQKFSGKYIFNYILQKVICFVSFCFVFLLSFFLEKRDHRSNKSANYLSLFSEGTMAESVRTMIQTDLKTKFIF